MTVPVDSAKEGEINVLGRLLNLCSSQFEPVSAELTGKESEQRNKLTLEGKSEV